MTRFRAPVWPDGPDDATYEPVYRAVSPREDVALFRVVLPPTGPVDEAAADRMAADGFARIGAVAVPGATTEVYIAATDEDAAYRVRTYEGRHP